MLNRPHGELYLNFIIYIYIKLYMKTLIIVESPAKAKKIQTFLGNDFFVKSSFGHICDLNTKKLKQMIENDFEPIYTINNKILKDLKDTNTTDIILAADDDREGDAIAWHCGRLLNVNFDHSNRIIFNEISKKSIQSALNHKTKLNMNSVNAQKCRQLLDLIIGYKLSPLLWKHIKTNEKGLSAGRVQSCLLKILTDHEDDINNKPNIILPIITARFLDEAYNFGSKKDAIFDCMFKSDKTLNNDDIVNLLKLCIQNKKFKIISSDDKEEINYSPQPFTTSSLQQSAYNELGFNVKLTMSMAQKLYESGIITYMRTDSTLISNDFKRYLQNHIVSKYGPEYYRNNVSKSNKYAQQAHEAIRPTNLDYSIDKWTPPYKKLYNLILRRTIQSHMSSTIYNVTNYYLSNNLIDNYGVFVYTVRDIFFEGYRCLDGKKPTSTEKISNTCTYLMDNAECKFKEQLPPKYLNESNIVKKLESTGIGRPSTYSSIINTLYTRHYTKVIDIPSYEKEQNIIFINNDNIEYKTETITVPKEPKKIIVTDLGKLVLEYLIKHFSMIINITFTASVEKDLDLISMGECNWKDIIKKIYNTFNPIVIDQMKFRYIKKDVQTFLGYQLKNGKFGPYLTNGTTNYNIKHYCKHKKISSDNLNDKHVSIIISYPKMIGKKDNKDIFICYGPYGEYMKYNNKNYKVDKRKINNIDYLISLIK